MSSSPISTKVRKTSGDEKSDRRKRIEKFNRKLAAECGRLLGEPVASMEFPGGRSRRSFRVILKNRGPVIVSFRPKRYRAEMERAVLKELTTKGALVPQLLGTDGRKMLIQEEIPGERLSEAMHGQDELRVERLLDSALTSLGDIHRAGSECGFDANLGALGAPFEWLVGLLDRPAVIGNLLEVPAPRPKLKQLETLLAIRNPRFIKWDSRPGNAMVREDDKVYWFDWEHCGTRNRLDDMAWLLTDEYVPDYPAVEERLIQKHVANFADDLSEDEARLYLSAYGAFHSSVRLGLICKYKIQGDWWGQDYCLKNDKVGITWECMLRICERGARWANRNPYTEALSPWFIAIADRFEAQSLEESVHVR